MVRIRRKATFRNSTASHAINTGGFGSAGLSHLHIMASKAFLACSILALLAVNFVPPPVVGRQPTFGAHVSPMAPTTLEAAIWLVEASSEAKRPSSPCHRSSVCAIRRPTSWL
ncbi:hypothetical protein PVAP13_5NG251000 [Panicum virgatum]|uniref:Uncharacterized protein n=1 Tax=Panicum virgatum TaxID=38727 RepID=A0A8T0RRN0_PANVG|nr:hypothetical protein PVAP13_5NG251000 [Panicum virgatum]